MTIAEKIRKIAEDARQASIAMARLSSGAKNDLLMNMALALINNTPHLIEENRKDLAAGEKKGLSAPLLDRLMLNEARIQAMAEALREVAALPDPVGEVTRMWKRPNDLMVGKMRIPLGVIGIVYEARPNVTADAAALCLKSGNAVILRGGSEAIYSNVAIARILQEEMGKAGHPGRSLDGHSLRRAGRGAGTAQAGGVHRPDHPPRRREPDPLRGGALQDPGHQALQGGLPHFRRCLRRFRHGGADHRQRQDPAPRRLQRPGDPPDPQGRGGDLRPLVLPRC